MPRVLSLRVLLLQVLLACLVGVTGCLSILDGEDDTGSSKISCPSGLRTCNGECVDLNSSPEHCGYCGNACESGKPCVEGVCSDECADTHTACGSDCADLQSDPKHCGACDRSCRDGVPCFGGDCGCPEGTLICRGQCVDPGSDRAHCGGCDLACADDELCVSGTCQPAANGCPFDTCDETCVDTKVSPVHCGSCDGHCAQGQSCNDGSCGCSDSEKTFCDGRCVDVDEDPEHCGSCGNACTGGYPCTDGECGCPSGQELCDGACVATESSLEHCGSCGNACPNGKTCIVGRCSVAAEDECTSTPAAGITLREVALFQAGKIGLMADGAPVDERDADVIAGKAGVVRVYVDVAPSFSSRVLSARLSLFDGDELVEQRFHKRTVSSSSVESNYNSTFNIPVPEDVLTPSMSYVVEIVECDAGAPGATSDPPRYPASGWAPFDARDTGRLKIRFIPIVPTNGTTPDVTPARLDAYAAYVAAMYPVAGVDYSVGSTLNVDFSIPANDDDSWEEALNLLAARHNADNAPNDLYYYGLFEPTSASYCNSGCIAGMGFVVNTAHGSLGDFRVSFGISKGTRFSAETFAHELGHTHGRDHTACGGAGQPDPLYPHPGGQIGWWGFEVPNTLHSPTRTDIMGYCEDPWVSDYVYRHFTERVAALNNSVALRTEGSFTATWRTIRTGAHPPKWGAPFKRPTTPSGTPELARILDENGTELLEITVYRVRIGHSSGATVMVPEPEPGWYAIQLAGEPPLPFEAVQKSVPWP